MPTPPSSAGAAQVSQSWLPKAGSTLQPDPMYRQKRLALEDDAPSENFVSFDEMVAAARGLPPAGGAAPDEPPDEIDEEGYF